MSDVNLSNKTANIFITIANAQNDALSYLFLYSDTKRSIKQAIVIIIDIVAIIISNVNIKTNKI